MTAEAISLRATSLWPYHVSAGCLVLRPSPVGAQVALLHRRRGGKTSWHLPKGTIESAEESLVTAALRETREESGLQGDPIAYLGSLNRRWKNRRPAFSIDKTIHYFLIKWNGEAPLPADREHDGMTWFTIDEAMATLSKQPKGEQFIVERAKRWLERFPDHPALIA